MYLCGFWLLCPAGVLLQAIYWCLHRYWRHLSCKVCWQVWDRWWGWDVSRVPEPPHCRLLCSWCQDLGKKCSLLFHPRLSLYFEKKYLCCWKNIKSTNGVCARSNEVDSWVKSSCAHYTVTKKKGKPACSSKLRAITDCENACMKYTISFIFVLYSDYFFQILLILLWNKMTPLIWIVKNNNHCCKNVKYMDGSISVFVFLL